MKKTVLITIISVLLFLTGCNKSNGTGNLGNDSNKAVKDISSTVNSKEGQADTDFVTDWLYQSLLDKFNNLEIKDKLGLIKRGNVTCVRVNMKNSDRPQIAAYITLNHIEGYFVLYEFYEGNYKEVYSIHQPVYGMQVYGGWMAKQMIAFVSGNGGTGYQENYFHLIGYTKDGYKEIWSGLAEKLEFGQLPHYRTMGALNLSMDNQLLIYSKIKHEYDKTEENIINPDKVEKTVELYSYDPQSDKFTLATK